VARSSPSLSLLVCALALAGCAKVAERAATKLFQGEQPLVFDRASDLLPPESLRVTSSADRQIALAWDPVLVGDVAGYAILRSAGSGDAPFKRVGITTSRFGTVFVDAGEQPGSLGDGQTYSYRVHPYDRQGRVSRSHAFLNATTEGRPPIPEGLQVYSNLPRRAVLSWKPSDTTAVAGYAVYRSPTMAGPWERVAFAEGRLNSVYEDTIPGDLSVMYYRIAALNRFGGESEMTVSPIRAVTKAEPLPPIGLRADARRIGRVELHWSPNVETDLRGYEVWRSARDAAGFHDEVRIGSVAADQSGFADTAVGCGETVRYRVRALDADGLESTFSEPLEVTGTDLGLRLAREGTGLVLHWDPARAQSYPNASVRQIRSVLPDRQLATVTGASQAALPDLPAGATLELALGGQSEGTEPAPACRIAVPAGS
jgi:fibronectin type 3 domain-containing protein